MFCPILLSIVLALSTQSPQQNNGSPESAVTPSKALQQRASSLGVSVLWLQKVRKHGPWDYKQQSSEYSKFTFFNFGATARAAGLDEASIAKLANESSTWTNPPVMDEAELQNKFVTKKDLLTALRKMADEDIKLARIAPDFIAPAETTEPSGKALDLSRERWNQYKLLFREIGLDEGVVRSDNFSGTIFFVVRARGLCTGGSSEGYAYSTTQLKPVVESLPARLKSAQKDQAETYKGFIFKLVATNWYMYYEAD